MQRLTKISSLLIAVVVFGLVLAGGCGGGGGSQTGQPSQAEAPGQAGSEQTKPPQSSPSVISIATKEAGTISHTLSTAMAELISSYAGVKAVVEPVGGSGAWLPLMERGEIEIGHEVAYPMVLRYPAVGPFSQKKPVPFARQMLAYYPGSVVLQVRADSKIHSMEDLKGTKIFSKLPDAPLPDLIMEATFRATDLKPEDVNQLTYSTADATNTAAQQVIEGRADGIFWSISSLTLNLERSTGVRIIPPSKEIVDAANDIIEEQAGKGIRPFTYENIWGPNYMGVKANTDLPTYVNWGLWIVREDVPEETVYNMMKAIYDHYDEIKDVHPEAKNITAENAIKSQIMAYHSGAVRFFKERGLWTPELEAQQQRELQRAEQLKSKL